MLCDLNELQRKTRKKKQESEKNAVQRLMSPLQKGWRREEDGIERRVEGGKATNSNKN